MFKPNRPNENLAIDIHVDLANARPQLNSVAGDHFIAPNPREIERLSFNSQLQTHVRREVAVF